MLQQTLGIEKGCHQHACTEALWLQSDLGVLHCLEMQPPPLYHVIIMCTVHTLHWGGETRSIPGRRSYDPVWDGISASPSHWNYRSISDLRESQDNSCLTLSSTVVTEKVTAVKSIFFILPLVPVLSFHCDIRPFNIVFGPLSCLFRRHHPDALY